MMRVHVVGNAAFDETVAVAAWPVPGELILGRAVASGPGGKGLNQAVALARAGVPTRLVAGIAADVRGAAIRQALAGEPLSADLVEMPDRATDTSIVLSAPDGDNCNITTTGCADALGPAAVEAALASANPEDVLLVQGNLGKAATRAALVMAGRRGMLRVMNPSPLRPWQADLLPECEMIFVNAAEAAFLTACPQERAAEALRDVGVGTVIITLGAAGATASGPEGSRDRRRGACPCRGYDRGRGCLSRGHAWIQSSAWRPDRSPRTGSGSAGRCLDGCASRRLCGPSDGGGARQDHATVSQSNRFFHSRR